MLPACDGLFPLNFWWEVMELGHARGSWGERQGNDGVKGHWLLHSSLPPGLPFIYLLYLPFKK